MTENDFVIAKKQKIAFLLVNVVLHYTSIKYCYITYF